MTPDRIRKKLLCAPRRQKVEREVAASAPRQSAEPVRGRGLYRPLLTPERLDRISARGSERWDRRGNRRRDTENDEHRGEGHRIDWTYAEEKRTNRLRQHTRKQESGTLVGDR